MLFSYLSKTVTQGVIMDAGNRFILKIVLTEITDFFFYQIYNLDTFGVINDLYLLYRN